MNAARRLLCGIAIGLWAGLSFGVEPGGEEPRYIGSNASRVQHWESPRPRKATYSTSPAAAWDDGGGRSAVRQASVQTPFKPEPVAEPIKPTPDVHASGGTPAATGAPAAPAPAAAPAAAGHSRAPVTRAQAAPGARAKIVPEADAYLDGSVPMGAGARTPQRCPYNGPPGAPLDEGLPCPADCGPCCPMPILSFWAGVHGFKGPADLGRTGDFGFQEGVNWSASVLGSGVSYQIGLNATQSNLSGDQTPNALHDGERDQIFVTTGLFHRAVCGGLQWGVVYDYLRDGYLENFELQQLRSEMSLVLACGNEIGFWGAFGMNSDDFQPGLVKANDIYAFFYRKTAESGSQGRLWGGWTPEGALVGADAHFPLSTSFALEGSINYLIPDHSSLASDQRHETWSLAVNLVYYMGRNPGLHHSPVRPLMPVADNSYFLINTRP